VEATRQVLLATAQVRALAQKRGEPVLMLVKSASKIEAHIPEYPTASAATDILRRVTLFKFFREFPVGGAQLLSIQDATGSVRTAGNAAAWVIFCPSGDAHFVYDSSSLPICGVGDLASHSGKLQFVANSEAFHIYIRQALGTVNLVTGI
jgi:hypothetical protein